ncbi:MULTISPECIES: VWA domain-containing protein [unclassified Streptomyces]|uniref:vWA domain-containing protein n=1 Tax=unclassified Streptomyces TaxID=2593676 RepID=UPI001F047046|nr:MULTISPECIES: VWA domain-containing protein [unclassified Streptomyces]MCH0565965.1 VWA domain-containing protein [Streptomyces sp. MUM 2J]MCH0569130.1 VWA domain-containing protein [Streptomyces sp. MUM 136J]
MSARRSPPLALCLVLVAVFASLTACSGDGGGTTTLHVLASDELADMEPVLTRLREDTGVRLAMHYRPTNDASDTLVTGRHSYDLAWLSSDRYLRLRLKGRGGAGSPPPAVQSTSIMRSPVVVGLTPDVARRLHAGVPGRRLSWADIADAAATGTVRFGMADPRHTNSGLAALVGVATAASGTGGALRPQDVGCDRLRGFRSGQALTAGTSSALLDDFAAHPGRTNALITYESALLRLNASGRLAQPLEIVHPADGMVLSDYPLLLLDTARRAAYDKVVGWLTAAGHQREIMRETLRRPVSTAVRRDDRLASPVGNALYFPDDPAVLDRLLADYGDPGAGTADQVIFLLDFSGSMRGARTDALRAAFASLSGADTSSTAKFVRFHLGERLTVVRFGGRPLDERTVTVRGPRDLEALEEYVAGGGYDGSTAIWSALDHGYRRAQQAVRDDPARTVSIVLMTDGENNAGLGPAAFAERYRARPAAARAVPTYPVRFGGADAAELRQVASLTGGRMVDGHATSLSAAFKEIRGCH